MSVGTQTRIKGASRGAARAVERFRSAGSPLEGRAVPADWAGLSLHGKRSALVRVGYARDYRHACSMLGKHSGAVRSARARGRADARRRRENCWWNK